MLVASKSVQIIITRAMKHELVHNETILLRLGLKKLKIKKTLTSLLEGPTIGSVNTVFLIIYCIEKVFLAKPFQCSLYSKFTNHKCVNYIPKLYVRAVKDYKFKCH